MVKLWWTDYTMIALVAVIVVATIARAHTGPKAKDKQAIRDHYKRGAAYIGIALAFYLLGRITEWDYHAVALRLLDKDVRRR